MPARRTLSALVGLCRQSVTSHYSHAHAGERAAQAGHLAREGHASLRPARHGQDPHRAADWQDAQRQGAKGARTRGVARAAMRARPTR
eukprot:2741288-Pleurochrysis_carterae.AAC.1